MYDMIYSLKLMTYISAKDLYEIRIAGLVSNIDKDVIIELYQPIMGSKATILYLTLLKQKRNEDDETYIFSHEELLSLMQIVPGDLFEAKRVLEAVGLMRTFEKEQDSKNQYIYVLYSPKTPNEFFDDPLFKPLLIQKLGYKETKRLAHHYHYDTEIPGDYVEVSARWHEVFHLDLDDKSLDKKINENVIGHESGRAKIYFDNDVFFEYISNHSQIRKSVFKAKDLRTIEKISALFGLNEETMADIVLEEYNPESEEHFDFERISKRAEENSHYSFLQKGCNAEVSKITGDTALIKDIHKKDTLSPYEFLSEKQGGTRLASSDVDIIKSLMMDYGFGNGVINTIIDFALEHCNNVLNKKYCEKIAVSLMREGIKTAIDALNYLSKPIDTKTVKKSNETNLFKASTKKVQKAEPKNDEEEISDDEILNIINDIENSKKKGGK